MDTVIDKGTIDAIARLITEHFDVERIVLFGSYARDEAEINSDIDLLVEVRAENMPTGPGNPIRRLIAQHFVLPIDVIVHSTISIHRHRNNPYSLIHQALKDGIILYDRQPPTLV